MHINLGNHVTLTQTADGQVIVTRPGMTGVNTHIIHSKYDAFCIGQWLYYRERRRAPLIQDAFPEMNADDREFLMTGITPAQWEKMMQHERDEPNDS
jgi:hypothetical protein